MPQITPDLIRKHAEHNDHCLETLEEISLNQLHLASGALDALNSCCPNLKIAYLQGNLIDRIGKTGRLKRLEYLNVALNNLKDLRGLERCESLRKLDVTLNFLQSPRELLVLKDLPCFQDLYTTGNPCENLRKYKEFVIACLPNLRWLNGDPIKRSERIRAETELKSGLLLREIQDQEKALLELEKDSSGSEHEKQDEDVPQTTKHTPEGRREAKQAWIEMHAEQEEEKDEDSRRGDSRSPSCPAPRRYFKADGVTPLNVNTSKIPFKLDDCGDHVLLVVRGYKHLEASLLDVDVEPTYVRVRLKDEVLQLRLDHEVRPDSSSFRRCRATGDVSVVMPKLDVHNVQFPEKNSTAAAAAAAPPPDEKNIVLNPATRKPHWRETLRIRPAMAASNSNRKPPSRASVSVPVRADSPSFRDDPSVPPLE